MTGDRTTTTLLRLGVAAALLGVGASACTSDAKPPESNRRCAVVQADELSDLAGTKVELLKADKGSTVCRFVSKDGSVEIRTSVDGPVEAGLPELLLTEPTKVDGIGNEAWYATRNTPLGTRLLARRKGALLTLDLSAIKMTGKERRALAKEIAKAGVPNLPNLPVKAAAGLRGKAACERYATDEVSVALGGVPTVTPSTPPGSCLLEVDDQDLTASVSVLMETGAGTTQLDGLVAGVPDAQKTKVGDAPAYWIPSTQGPSTGGQLDVLSNGKILQIAVIGQGFAKGEAQQVATSLAKTATAT
ncbi:MAG: hypothetical protein U0P45_04895 [Acidimicrobiales bacterium]